VKVPQEASKLVGRGGRAPANGGRWLHTRLPSKSAPIHSRLNQSARPALAARLDISRGVGLRSVILMAACLHKAGRYDTVPPFR
jgi:hypothetical protein